MILIGLELSLVLRIRQTGWKCHAKGRADFSGENYELRQQLNSEYREKRADAIKRVIANHTIGKDCSGLFPDVVKNMVSAGFCIRESST
jgi:hypothetical protein